MCRVVLSRYWIAGTALRYLLARAATQGTTRFLRSSPWLASRSRSVRPVPLALSPRAWRRTIKAGASAHSTRSKRASRPQATLCSRRDAIMRSPKSASATTRR
eukprot:Amastigsp_a841804_114.p4 type:complete len:103 gc:universal Amastigsp_a841804_114:311-619(+)